MSNPLRIATKGKGFLPMLARGWSIVSRYGINANKMDHSLAKFSAVVQQYAGSMTFPVTASALVANQAVAMKYHNQDLELAIHGLYHIDYSSLTYEKQLGHLSQARQIFQKAGIPVAGFRCPYLRWSADTLAALSASGFTYDSSQALALDVVQGLETDAYRRVLGFYRALPAQDYPALPRLVDGLVRIPYCLPDDEALVERLNLSGTGSMDAIWLAMLDRSYAAGELFTLGLHPERISLCQGALQAVLAKARSLSPGVWIARLNEITAWFLALGKTSFEIRTDAAGLYNIHIQAPARSTILVRSLQVNGPTQPWMEGYHSILSNEATIRSSKRPVIGISPETPVSLSGFLRHQGYLVETSTDPQACSCYLDLTSFTEKDERSLISKLEQECVPLIRLSRWPDGARSALAITGDIDAFTLWDYGRRILNG